MLHTTTQELIRKIAEMTRQQKLVWSETSNGVFRYETEGYQVHITQNPIEVLLTDLSGREIERADSLELAETETDSGESFTRVVGSLRKDVARQVRGTDAAIASILAGLDLDEPTAVEADTEATVIAVNTVEEIAEDRPTEVEFEANTAAGSGSVNLEDNHSTDIAPEENDTKDEDVGSFMGATAAASAGLTAVLLSTESEANEATEDPTADLRPDEAINATDTTPSSVRIEGNDVSAVQSSKQTLTVDADASSAAPVEDTEMPIEAINEQETGLEIESISETPQAQDITDTLGASFAARPVLANQTVEQVTETDAAGAGDQNDEGGVSAFGLGVTEFDAADSFPEVEAAEPVVTEISSESHFSTETAVDDFTAIATVEAVEAITTECTPISDAQSESVLTEQDQVEGTETSSAATTFGDIGAFGSTTAVVAATQLDTAETVTESVADISQSVAETVLETTEPALETTETATESAQQVVDIMTQEVMHSTAEMAANASDTAADFAAAATTGTADLVDEVTTNIFGDTQPSITDDKPEATANPDEATADLAAAKIDYKTYNPWS